jgi:indolepyruvate ferredoxin oxidoreductase
MTRNAPAKSKTSLRQVALNDKYDLSQDRIFVSGTQAIVRLALMQHALDKRAGHNTAGYITGYRGSPLGGMDQQLRQAHAQLSAANIVFNPGINEDLAATAIWGAQQAELRGEGKYDGVFSLWYGKGPGVDRSGDVFRHANHAGTSKYGGVLALMGDDHTCESSTSAHQSEFAFVDAMMPVLNPAGVQEIIDYGLFGWALSRYAGVWVGLKCVKDNVEQTGSIDAGLDRVEIVIPDDFDMPAGGLNIRLRDEALAKEERLHIYKRAAVLAFTKANKLDRILLKGGRKPKLGVVTAGKSYLDVAEALELLGIDEVRAAELGLKLYKVAVTWPLEPGGIERFAKGLERIIVVEEKRSLIETQIREQLYGKRNAPAVLGKRDEKGKALFQAHGALEPVQIALAIGKRIVAQRRDGEITRRLKELEVAAKEAQRASEVATRVPYFCAGCPHSSSTVVPGGSRAYAGIGCHYMVQWMDRSTEGFTQMGGEGANWIGEAPFSNREHVYQNIGDGTYIHSGSLAIRAAVAAGTNVTYKLLYNDAVAMTGGQSLDGAPSVPQIARQLAAEGANRVVVVSDEPDKYPSDAEFPAGTSVHHRDELGAVQKSLRSVKGVSVLIYDQTCAAEKRRRRKRGQFPDPAKRIVINEMVCEGCGDCGVKSNCVAIIPVETEYGRKRAIDQSACNKDYSCLKGFCPSFVTVHGGQLRKSFNPNQQDMIRPPGPDSLPEPAARDLDTPYSMIITGVGGTGVVTLGALIGMAAHLENKGVGVIDMAGLAQKGGAVAVHVRVANKPDDINAIRASNAGTDMVLGCDLVVTASQKVLATVRQGVTTVVANSHDVMTADFTSKPDLALPMDEMKQTLSTRTGAKNSHFIDAHNYAGTLIGDTIASNMFLLGYAFQLGQIPVSSAALEEAIRLNGVAVDGNLRAFRWGRLTAHDIDAVDDVIAPRVVSLPDRRLSQDLEDLIERRERYLTSYQNAAYAKRYRDLVEAIQRLENDRVPHSSALTEAVARYYFKLLAVKDEFEVARLYTDGSFKRQVEAQFEGDYHLEFHMAPPLLAKKDAVTGEPKKRRFGSWMMAALKLLAATRSLRGSILDPFRFSSDRVLERRLLNDYEKTLDEIGANLSPENIDIAVALAELPETVRGYGHIKARMAETADQRRSELLGELASADREHRDAA